MIFHQPLILASEFVTHAVLIVLMGIVVVEYASQKACLRENVRRKRAFYAIAAMTVLGSLWVFLDFFVSLEASFFLFLRYALLIGIIALVFYMAWMTYMFSNILRIPKKLGVALVLAILLFILFDVLYRATGTPAIGVLYALFRVIGVCTYYFFIMCYFLDNDTYDNV